MEDSKREKFKSGDQRERSGVGVVREEPGRGCFKGRPQNLLMNWIGGVQGEVGTIIPSTWLEQLVGWNYQY